MLSELDILNQLKQILIGMDEKNVEKVKNVNYDTKLITDLGFSSIGMLYMVIAMEETFNIEFVDDKPFETVGDVVSYIKERVK